MMINEILDATNEYIEKQYGISAVKNPIDRQRIINIYNYNKIRNKIKDLYWKSKESKFNEAPNLENFAHGVEERLSKAFILINQNRPENE